ncbi:hypothetical protein EW026_g179 [Hermanssonia centrifuga]|uniref:Uncharacterized protein n=1 Tax=Hermanssonia centrifuga TaxID=98765 RepID=A0A4S4KWK7_9APHY|nr:hypothetical protein EW026_g179 [Hermanssonia centrifuga]
MSWKHPSIVLAAAFTVANCATNPLSVQTPSEYAFDDVKVPVVLGVMSQCPDAILCESVFDHVLQRVPDKIDLSLTFIGTTNASEPDFGVTCMHGPTECAGNVQELCALKYTPTAVWWRFVQCQNFQGRYEVGKPETALKCADAAKIDWENSGVGECAGLDASGKGEEGVQLLLESVKKTKKMGIQKSCTIVINGKPVCIHDESWKECEGGHTPADFVRQINDEYDRLNGDDLEGA